jgi:hypothetical protein
MEAANSLKDRQSPAYAHIPTTIIYTLTDEIVTPQIGGDVSLICCIQAVGNHGLTPRSPAGILSIDRSIAHFDPGNLWHS